MYIHVHVYMYVRVRAVYDVYVHNIACIVEHKNRANSTTHEARGLELGSTRGKSIVGV